MERTIPTIETVDEPAEPVPAASNLQRDNEPIPKPLPQSTEGAHSSEGASSRLPQVASAPVDHSPKRENSNTWAPTTGWHDVEEARSPTKILKPPPKTPAPTVPTPQPPQRRSRRVTGLDPERSLKQEITRLAGYAHNLVPPE